MENIVSLNLRVKNNSLTNNPSSGVTCSSEFVHILDNVSENNILNELQKQYPKNIINFTIAEESMVKMEQNENFKDHILDKIDSFVNSSFVKLHPNLSYEVHIDADGKIAYSIEVPKLIDEEEKTVRGNLEEARNQDDYLYLGHLIPTISSCSVNEIIEIKNRLKFK